MKRLASLTLLLLAGCASTVTVRYEFDNTDNGSYSSGTMHCSSDVLVRQVGSRISVSCPPSAP